MIAVGSTIVLAGPPGAGKSTVARALAGRLGCDAVDLDEVIEARHGRSPAALIRADGEGALRAAESDVLSTLDADVGVLALGGGTLTTTHARSLSRSRGPVVGLSVGVESLAERLSRTPGDRPLLSGGVAALTGLLHERARSYRAVDAVVDAQNGPEDVVSDVLSAAGDARVLTVPVGDHLSRVVIGRGIAPVATRGAVANLAPRRPVLLIVDGGAPGSHAVADAVTACEPSVRVDVEGGERSKTWEVLGQILERAVAGNAGRQSVVVGIGGGATCDLAGLAAALLGRGAPLILVPTTLLAQADAALGGKCAVDVGAAKNLAGAFHPASEVIVDLDLLATLSPRDQRAGLAEILKAGIIGDPELFRLAGDGGALGVDVMLRALAVKARIVAEDPFERGLRKVLNLGHTLGHALETASGFELRHGEAVAMGTAAAARMSAARGLTTQDTAQTIVATLERCGLPTLAPADLLQRAAPHLKNDKKAVADAVDLILIRRIGEVCAIELPWTDAATELLRAGGGQ